MWRPSGAVFDIGTGAWTEETYTIMFPGLVTQFYYSNCYFGPFTRSDGLGYLIVSYPDLQV